MKNKSVLVTGGSGFIGANLARELSAENQVKVIDDLSTGHFKNIQDLADANKIEFIKGSITDLDLLQSILKNVDYVFHHAAIPSVPKSIKDPIRSNNVNVNGTLNVLTAAKDNGVKKVIFASSSSVYGDTSASSQKEDMLLGPLSPYAVSKLAGEYYCKVFSEVYNLPTVSIRYFNVYGPRQDPSGDYAAVIPKFICKALKNEPLVIYGDGKQTRDFTFIKDIVNGNILAAESTAAGVFNVADGKCISINKLANLIMEISGKKLDLVHDDPLSGEVKYSLADISKAKEKLAYEPKFNINEGLTETIKWFQTQS